MTTALRELIDAVFPPRCALCGGGASPPEGGGGDWACGLHRLPDPPKGPRCGRCAVLLPAALLDGGPCPDCRRAPFGVEQTLALFDWRTQPSVHPWVLALKYGGRADLAEPLGALLGRAFAARRGGLEARLGRKPLQHAFTHVPLHPRRRFERGYDQAERLAAAAAEAAGVPLLAPHLRRVRPTAVQGGPGSRSRRANLHGALRWDGGPGRPAEAGRSDAAGRSAEAGWSAEDRAPRPGRTRLVVWVVDDVITSGASVAEAARALRANGLRRVAALALARAGPGAAQAAAGKRADAG